MEFRAAILAAGESKRMGSQKLLMRVRGRAMIDRAIDAAREWNPVVVASPEVAEFVGERENVRVVLNGEPQRGMAHSLALADAAIPKDSALIVLLGDKPLVTADLVARICEAAAHADVAFPRHPHTHEPGHPVVFSPRARTKIALLPDGDSLRLLRDDPEFVRREIATDDCGAYVDIDTAAELE